VVVDVMLKWILIAGLSLMAVSVGVAFAGSSEVSRQLPGSVTINIVTMESLADIGGNGTVDSEDLQAVMDKFNTQSAGGEREDINGDGVIDILDLTLVARLFGREAA
jgi:hypothetical protein